MHGQKGKQGQLPHIDLQVGRTLEMYQRGHAVIRPARRGRPQRCEERGHQQGRRHGKKAVHPHVEHGQASTARMHHGERAGGGELGLPFPEQSPHADANQAIVDLHLRAEKPVVAQARSPQEAGQIVGLEGHHHLAQPEAMILEAGHTPRHVERESQAGDLQLQFFHATEGSDVPTSQAQQASPLDEGKSECPIGVSHDPPRHRHCRTGGRGVHRS